MQIVSYKQCEDLWLDLIGEAVSDALDAKKDKFNRAFNRTLRRGWEWHWWPDLMRCEERLFRAKYADTTSYTASTLSSPTEVWFSATRKYYQCIKDTSTGSSYWPATLVSGVWTLNSAYWAECAYSYEGDLWADATAYVRGDIVRAFDPIAAMTTVDGLPHVCHTAHTSSGSFDETKFGLLTQFRPYVAYAQTGQTAIGGVRECYLQDPRATANRARRVAWELDELGVRCTAYNVPDAMWLDYRRRCPSFRGAVFSATATYSAGAIRYYSSSNDGYDGDFWEVQATTTAGQDPEDTPAKWSRLEIPAFLMDFAVHGAKIAFLDGEGQLEKALADVKSDLWTHLYDEADKLMASAHNRPRRARAANL